VKDESVAPGDAVGVYVVRPDLSEGEVEGC
jgi:hypothetical protein